MELLQQVLASALFQINSQRHSWKLVHIHGHMACMPGTWSVQATVVCREVAETGPRQYTRHKAAASRSCSSGDPASPVRSPAAMCFLELQVGCRVGLPLRLFACPGHVIAQLVEPEVYTDAFEAGQLHEG